MWCQEMGLLCLKMEVPQQKGFPDRMVLDQYGNTTFIELKRSVGGRVSPHQAYWFEKLSGMGFVVGSACNLDEAIRLVVLARL